MNNTDQIDSEVRSRFNPCLFLGQYLMRQNHNINPESPLSKLLLVYSKIENINRYFIHRFDTIHKIFIKSIGKDKKVCDVSEAGRSPCAGNLAPSPTKAGQQLQRAPLKL